MPYTWYTLIFVRTACFKQFIKVFRHMWKGVQQSQTFTGVLYNKIEANLL